MKKENSNDLGINNLIKKTLKDDLPLDVESSMKKQLTLFRKKMEQSAPQHRMEIGKAFGRLFQGEGPPWIQWMFKKSILASVSIIMVALGGFLQISGSHSALAESISLLETSVLVSDQVSRIGSMECSMQVSTKNDTSLIYSIQWLSPNLARVDVKKPDKTIIKTMWLKDEEITIADNIKNTLRKGNNFDEINDPQFQPVIGFLSPLDLVERMYGRWQLKQYKQHGDCEWGTFFITIPEEKALLEITVDLCTYLPINIKKFLPNSTIESGKEEILMNVHFNWNIPIPPQLLLPKSMKESHNNV